MRTLFCVLAKMWHAQCSLFISVVIFTVIWDHLVWYSTKVRFLDCSLSAVKPSLPQIISDWICDPLEFKSLEFVLGKWVSRLPRNYAGRDIFSYISSFFANHLHVKEDVGSAGAMPAKAAGSPFFDSRVTFLAGPASLHKNFLAQPTRSTRSRRDNQSMRERFWQGNGVNLFSHISARCENDPLSRNKFSPYKRGLLYLF